jgi:hypothetical protein
MLATYNLNLPTILVFGDLAAAFLVEVGSVDAGLQLLDFSGLRAYLLDFLLLALTGDSHLGQLSGKLLFHAQHVHRTCGGLEACDAVASTGILGTDTGVESCLAECHII